MTMMMSLSLAMIQMLTIASEDINPISAIHAELKFLWQQASNEIRFISSPPQTNQKILMMIFFQFEKKEDVRK